MFLGGQRAGSPPRLRDTWPQSENPRVVPAAPGEHRRRELYALAPSPKGYRCRSFAQITRTNHLRTTKHCGVPVLAALTCHRSDSPADHAHHRGSSAAHWSTGAGLRWHWCAVSKAFRGVFHVKRPRFVAPHTRNITGLRCSPPRHPSSPPRGRVTHRSRQPDVEGSQAHFGTEASVRGRP